MISVISLLLLAFVHDLSLSSDPIFVDVALDQSFEMVVRPLAAIETHIHVDNVLHRIVWANLLPV